MFPFYYLQHYYNSFFSIFFCCLITGGMPNTPFYTRQRYINGISGCISEIVLAGELRLNLDAKTLGTAQNVEPGAP